MTDNKSAFGMPYVYLLQPTASISAPAAPDQRLRNFHLNGIDRICLSIAAMLAMGLRALRRC